MSEKPNYDHLIAQWHPTKNGELQFTDFTRGSDYVAWWLCNESECGCPHEWPAQINHRTCPKPRGCPFCSPYSEACCYHQSVEYLYPELMKQWHPTKNEGIDPGKLRPGARISVSWLCIDPICKCRHEWDATIKNRTRAKRPAGCPFCNGGRVCIHNSLEYKYPEIAKEWDVDENGDLKPSEVGPRSSKIVSWICTKNPAHHWDAAIRDRTKPGHQTGCRHCRNKTEWELFEWLKDQLPDHTIEPQATFDWCSGPITNRELPYDFYIMELNRIVELDGQQHFENVANWKSFKETRKTDIYKMKLALDHGITVIRITQTMFKKRKAEMKDILLPHILNEELNYVFLSEGNEYRNHKAMLTRAMKNSK